jgi:2-haloacid dehalogenase
MLLAETLPEWRPFPDTNEALRRLKDRYRLGILSNIDQDLFTETARHFEVDFDVVVTAEDVRSYKPGHLHFLKLIEDYADSDSVLHVAQSLYHDGRPAGDLNIAFVWINRYNEVNTEGVTPLAEYPDLKSLADAVDKAVGLRKTN